MLWKKYGQPVLLEEVKHFMLVILGLGQGKTEVFFLFVCFLTQDHLLSLYYECACCEGLGLPGYNRTLMDNSKMAGTEEESFTFKGDSGDM